MHPGDTIDFAAGFRPAEERHSDGSWSLAFLGEEPVEVLLDRAGRMPLLAHRRQAPDRRG
ncbi:MAG: hypothetical protein R3E03_05755 [Novosphingobium sp.]